MTVQTDEIKTVKNAVDAEVLEISDKLGPDAEGTKMLIAHGRLANFRSAYGWIKESKGGVALNSETAKALNVSVGNKISFIERS